MVALNKAGELLGAMPQVHAMTDVTGFGLAGHLVEMMEGAGCSANINYSSVSLLAGTSEYLSQRIVPDATFRNWNSYGQKVAFDKGVNVMEAFSVLPDPQTNGGLLFTVDPAFEEKLAEILRQKNIGAAAIGKVTEREEKIIRVSV
jgi:selenide,water dikinase